MTEIRSTPAAQPRWRRRKEARPAEIIEAALEAFVSRGYAGTRLEDIARSAGCTKGTIFLYFESKEELFKAVVRTSVVPRLAQAEQLVDRHQGSVRDLLEQLLRMRWDSIYASPLSGLPKLLLSEAGNFPDLARFYNDEVVARSQALIERVLRMGVERGEFRPMDTLHVARVAVTPILLAALWKHSFAPCVTTLTNPQSYFEAALEILLRGITGEGASPRSGA